MPERTAIPTAFTGGLSLRMKPTSPSMQVEIFSLICVMAGWSWPSKGNCAHRDVRVTSQFKGPPVKKWDVFAKGIANVNGFALLFARSA